VKTSCSALAPQSKSNVCLPVGRSIIDAAS
jgi:hypothetical protein